MQLTPYERIEYIHEQLREIRKLSLDGGYEFLAYLISQAYAEALDRRREEHEKKVGGPPGA